MMSLSSNSRREEEGSTPLVIPVKTRGGVSRSPGRTRGGVQAHAISGYANGVPTPQIGVYVWPQRSNVC